MSGIQNHVIHWLGIIKRMRNEKKISLKIHKIKNLIKIVKEEII